MSELLNAELRDGVLYLFPCGRIDSANAAGIEAEAESFRSQYPADSTVIDAEKLEYISSAGLRIILRLKKEIPNLKITNVNSEVYEIFDMTGFTEMMTIEKAYRRMSVEGCEVIGRGSNGLVYRIDPETIIKVYFNPDSLPDIQKERELARKAFVMGIPTAIPYDVVKVGNSYGSVFELLNAECITHLIKADPSRLEDLTGQYVDLLKKLHSTEVKEGELPDMKAVALRWADDIRSQLPENKWEKLMALISAVPDNTHMLHGDYHVKNIMIQNGEALLIDMDTLCYGDPVFEFASIFNAYIGFYAGKPPITGDSFIGIPYQTGVEIWNLTLKKYFGTDDEEYLRQVTDKSAVLGFTRILRRTLRREDMTDPVNAAAVKYYISAIDEALDRIDTLLF